MKKKIFLLKIKKVCLKNFAIVLHRTMIETSLNFYMVSYNPAYMVELKKGKLFMYFQNYLKKKQNGGKTDHGVKNEMMAKLREFFLILGVLQIISSLRQKRY